MTFNLPAGDLCAAKFSDGEWYRAKVEKVAGSQVRRFFKKRVNELTSNFFYRLDLQVSLLYIDYGNRETTTAVKCAGLPAAFASHAAFAQEYALACIALPKDVCTKL